MFEIGVTTTPVTQEIKDVHTKSTSNKDEITDHAISTVKHALIVQEDALDMRVANSPQHKREEHKPLIYMQKGNCVN